MKQWISAEQPTVDTLKLVSANTPEPRDGYLLVEVRAAALNFSDILMVQDKYQVRPPRSFVPGQEIAGTVVDAGNSSEFAVGDRIASKVDWGGFSEFASVRADMAFKLPDQISFAQGAALPVAYTTSMVALTECTNISPSDRVLIHAAAGGVGLAAVQIAKAKGATIIATASTPEKLALAEANGADYTVSYSNPDWFSEVKHLTNGTGATIIFDPVGGEIGTDSLRCIARDGTLLVVGFASGTIQKLPANRLLLKRAKAQGVYWSHDEDQDMLKRVVSNIFAMAEAGQIRPNIDDSFDFSQLPEALHALASRRSTGKIVLKVNATP